MPSTKCSGDGSKVVCFPCLSTAMENADCISNNSTSSSTTNHCQAACNRQKCHVLGANKARTPTVRVTLTVVAKVTYGRHFSRCARCSPALRRLRNGSGSPPFSSMKARSFSCAHAVRPNMVVMSYVEFATDFQVLATDSMHE